MSTTTFKHQIIFYFVCGAISTSCDFIMYYTMYHYGVQIDVAKGLSFVVASIISYFLNKHITFKTERRSFMEFTSFLIVHIGAMAIDVSANRFFVFLFGLFIVGQQKIILSFILATGCSVIANFAGQKFWVFRKK